MTNHIKEAIFEFIQNSDGTLHSLDVVDHFKLPADIIYSNIAVLIQEGRVHKKELYGWGKHYLRVVN